MSGATQGLSERVATRRAAHRPIVVAVGATGGLHALRVARALATRDETSVVVVSVVEPPAAQAR